MPNLRLAFVVKFTNYFVSKYLIIIIGNCILFLFLLSIFIFPRLCSMWMAWMASWNTSPQCSGCIHWSPPIIGPWLRLHWSCCWYSSNMPNRIVMCWSVPYTRWISSKVHCHGQTLWGVYERICIKTTSTITTTDLKKH